MRKVFTLFFCLLSLSCFAKSFDSKDGSFSISMPSKWESVKVVNNEVLSLKKGNSKISISRLVNCDDLSCIENIANTRLKQIKNKKFKLVKNTYSGEEIKKNEFSTLDPYFYFSYIANNINYTECYFSADSKGYKIGLANIPPADAYLYLSFIAPKPKEIKDLPLITDEKPVVEENITPPEVKQPDWKPLSETLPATQPAKKETVRKLSVPQRVMTPISVIFIYFSLVLISFIYNFIFSPLLYQKATNPNSVYPVIGSRLYGSPDLFFKLYDNQGQNFIVTSQRWSSFLKEYGFYSAIFFAFVRFIIMSMLRQDFTSSLWYNTSLSLCYLFVGIGLIFMLAGYVLDIIFPAPIFIYTDKGKILFKIVRRNNGFFGFAYLVLSDAYNVEYRLQTNKIFFIRKWTIFDKEGQIAIIRESSLLRALARKLLGHLGGGLRADYLVEGKNESKGEIISFRKATTNFQIDIDKPQAFPHIALLAASAVIFTKNRDKFYPWFD